jgi:hypothetical protein
MRWRKIFDEGFCHARERRIFMKRYKAPWGKPLVVGSVLSTIVLLGSTIGLIACEHGILRWLALIPAFILVSTLLLTVRGYAVAHQELQVQRLFWKTRISLLGLKSASFEPDAMRGSIRTFGNGCVFSISGFYSNRLLGPYRAFVTDPHLTVVLGYAARTVVVSPSSAEEFVQELRPHSPSAAVS